MVKLQGKNIPVVRVKKNVEKIKKLKKEAKVFGLLVDSRLHFSIVSCIDFFVKVEYPTA
jgi:hypothetical protein